MLIFSQMKSKELITVNIKQTLSEPLHQLGFRFSKNNLTFKRKVNNFEQTISFLLSKFNRENESAEFRISFDVSSKQYSKWYETEFGKKPVNNSIEGVKWTGIFRTGNSL